MNANQNSRLRHPLTRLHPLLIILAALAVFTLATAPVNAAPRQQTVVNICSRTAEVQTAILGKVPGPRAKPSPARNSRASRASPEPWLSLATAAPPSSPAISQGSRV